MIRSNRIILLAVISIVIFTARADAEEALKLATTTSTYETGILDYILPPFEKKNNCKVHVISVGTGRAIQLAKNGDVDIILVHAPDAEKRFVDEGCGVKKHSVMHNDFVILGPDSDPANIRGIKDAAEALKRIYKTESIFVSRGDDSGTDKKEKYLWSKSGVNPERRWYSETGQGMNATLRIADEKGAYVLLDRATHLYNIGNIRLIKLVEGAKELYNPYGVIAVNPNRHPHVNYKLSTALIEWLTSPECRGMIDGYTVNGMKLFYADKDI